MAKSNEIFVFVCPEKNLVTEIQYRVGLFIGVPFSGFAVPYFLLEYPRFPGLFQCSTLSAMGIGVSERPSPAYGQDC